jgi:hypothetical protein
MNDLPRRKLKELLATHGQELCTDWRRCRSLLKEQCPQDKKEIDVLIETLRNDRVEEELLTLPQGADVAGLLPRLTAQLQEDSELSEADARWGVESWAMALGLLPLPEPVPAEPPPPTAPAPAKEEAPPPPAAEPAPAEEPEPEPLPSPAPPAAPTEGMVAADRLADRETFYLGREYDLRAHNVLMEPEHEIHYPSRHLVTHGVVVGMTGSGKTGLCITLLEEAAIDGIPCIMIDPKGDLTNLLLQFPELRPEDFKEWLDPEDARQKSISLEKYAAGLAERWRKGIEESGQPVERIAQLKHSSEWRIYTPGSEAGLPLSILRTFAAPKGKLPREALNQKIDTTTTALLGLTGIAGDPVQSREHILIAQLLQHAWEKEKKDLTLGNLIARVQTPPMAKVGELEVDEFYPEKDRKKLAAALNNILASPSFSTWITGEPLDLGKMMVSPQKKPRQLIFYLAHLDDAQRMFFITLLLDEVVSWMRKQQGTTSLRALLYFDEVFGYLPPYPANPPTKQPLMTLLKQARAFGVGVLLATQNPVDLDYKALSNAGTWFVGKLQTERDKARLIEGLESVAAERGTLSDPAYLKRAIPALGNRIFLLHSSSQPKLFQTRWALSFLRGPATLDQIPRLLELAGQRREEPEGDQAEEAASGSPPAAAGEVRAAIPVAASAEGGPVPTAIPVATPAGPGGALAAIPLQGADPMPDLKLEPIAASAATVPAPAVAGVTQFYLATAGPRPARAQVVYQPRVLGIGEVVFADKRRNLEYRRTYRYLALPPTGDGAITWGTAEAPGITLADSPEPAVQWATVPESLNGPKKLKSLEKAFWDFLYSTRKLPLWLNRALDLISQPGEELADFRERCRAAATAELERALENERIKFEPKFKRLGVELPEKRGGSVLSWLIFGASDAHLTPKQKTQLRDLDNDWKRKRQELEDRWKQAGDDCSEQQLTPRKVDVEVTHFGLAWAPYWRVPNPAGWTDELPAYR